MHQIGKVTKCKLKVSKLSRIQYLKEAQRRHIKFLICRQNNVTFLPQIQGKCIYTI